MAVPLSAIEDAKAKPNRFLGPTVRSMPHACPDGPVAAARPLGELLLIEGLVTESQLGEALAAQQQQGGKLGAVLQDLGYLSPKVFMHFLARKAGVGSIELANYDIQKECVRLLPKDVAIRHELVAIEQLGRLLTVAMVYPLNGAALEEVEVLTGLKAKPVLCSSEGFWRTINRYYPLEDRGFGSADPSGAHDPLQHLEHRFLTASVAGLIRRMDALLPLSGALPSLHGVLDRPSSPLEATLDALMGDPPLAAAILAAANHDAYGFPQRVDTLDLAVRLVGPREVRRIAARVVQEQEVSPVIDGRRFRSDALFCARAAETIVKATDREHLAGAVVAALLGDVGRLALAQAAPAHYSRIEPQFGGETLVRAERDRVGLSHPEAGYILTSHWGLPADVCEAVLFHHEPKRAARARELTTIVAAAHALAGLAGATVEEGRATLDTCVDWLGALGLNRTRAAAVLTQVSLLRGAQPLRNAAPRA